MGDGLSTLLGILCSPSHALQVPKTSFKLNQAIITGKSVQQDYITPADLYRGAVINVFGNHITIVDVDKAAEDWHVTFRSDTPRGHVGICSAVLHISAL
jgi:hypothetical protein